MWADLICWTRVSAATYAQSHAWTRAGPRVQGYSLKGGLAAFEEPVAAHQAVFSTGAPAIKWAGLAMLAAELSNTCAAQPKLRPL